MIFRFQYFTNSPKTQKIVNNFSLALSKLAKLIRFPNKFPDASTDTVNKTFGAGLTKTDLILDFISVIRDTRHNRRLYLATGAGNHIGYLGTYYYII